MILLLPAMFRSLIEPRLPDGVTARWWTTADEAAAMIVDAEVASLDGSDAARIPGILAEARALKWLSSIGAGIEYLDHGWLRAHGVTLTNGSGLNSTAVADYALLGILAAAKRYDEVVRLTDRHEWTKVPSGKVELPGTRALIVGQGRIGEAIARRLHAFEVETVGVTRSGRDGTLTPDQWRGRLGEFDWVILAAPSTGETHAAIGAAELAAMKPTAWLVNIARGELVDQPALIAALKAGEIAGAFLDVVWPEPLPADDPLWDAPNCLQSMHLSGRSQTTQAGRMADLFLENLDAYRAGRPMRNVIDLTAGY